MRTPTTCLLASLLLVPLAGAAAQEIPIFLHETAGGLHLVPEIVNAKVGDTLKFTVTNSGESPHNFKVCGDGESPLESCTDTWGFSGMIQPNATAIVSATPTKAGTFDYYCYIPGHKGAGMAGKLVVQGGAETSGIPGLPAAGTVLAVATLALFVRRTR